MRETSVAGEQLLLLACGISFGNCSLFTQMSISNNVSFEKKLIHSFSALGSVAMVSCSKVQRSDCIRRRNAFSSQSLLSSQIDLPIFLLARYSQQLNPFLLYSNYRFQSLNRESSSDPMLQSRTNTMMNHWKLGSGKTSPSNYMGSRSWNMAPI